MSLINQMLRDLESRRKQDTSELAPEVTPAIPRQLNKRWLIAVAAIVVLVGGLLAGGLLQQAARSSQPVTVAPMSQQPPAGLSVAASASVVQSAARPEQPEQPQSPAAAARLVSLRLFESDAMTRLLLEFSQLPEYGWEHGSADGRQLQIRLRQADIRDSLQVPQPSGATLKGIELQKQQEDLLVLAKAGQKLSLELFELSADQSHGPRLMVEFYPEAAPVSNELPAATAEVAQHRELRVSEPAPATMRVKKTTAAKTPEQRAEALYQAALRQLQSNDRSAAETSLSHALSLQPQLLVARVQLVDLLLQSGRGIEAEQLLLQGLKREPQQPLLRKYYARRLLDRGQPQQALAVLQQDPLPALEADQEYFALLAALQRDTGQYQAAAATYQHLLRLRPQQALWWLGLAISLDQAGDQQQAREAYRQARALPGLRNDLRSYAEQRLQAL